MKRQMMDVDTHGLRGALRGLPASTAAAILAAVGLEGFEIAASESSACPIPRHPLDSTIHCSGSSLQEHVAGK